MDEQVFVDGIATISAIAGTVRLDFITYSPTEKDASGQPAAVFCQRLIMGTEAFLHVAEKIHEAAQTLATRSGHSEPAPPTPLVSVPTPQPVATTAPLREVHTDPAPRPPTKPPFP